MTYMYSALFLEVFPIKQQLEVIQHSPHIGDQLGSISTGVGRHLVADAALPCCIANAITGRGKRTVALTRWNEATKHTNPGRVVTVTYPSDVTGPNPPIITDSPGSVLVESTM